MKRCVSICQGTKEEDCTDPCTFVGKKYCRLSTQYKMEPPGCEVIKKKQDKSATKHVKSATKPVKSATKPILGPTSRPKTIKNTKPVKSVTKPASKPASKPSLGPTSRPKTIKNTKPVTKPVKSVAKPVKPMTKPILGPTSRLKTIKNTKVSKPATKLDKPILGPTLRPKTIKVSKPAKPKKSVKYANSVKSSVNRSRNQYARTIQSFMKKTEGKRKALFYGTLCSDSGVCIALGKEKQKLLEFFNFTSFDYAKSFKTIGTASVNGFVKEVKYEREGYSAYAILKSSARPRSDSLSYEYLVGKYLNEVSKRFPAFVETYGLYHYPTVKERDEMKAKDILIRKLIPFDPNNIRDTCRKAKNICTLIQHIKNARTFADYYEDSYFREHVSAYVLYQVFFTLHQIRTEFTHYDLHQNNVLLYEPVPGKYIHYHYHYPDRVVQYKSKYLVKIIDYGRSFYKDGPDYYKKICAESACEPRCGSDKGFGTFFLDLSLGRFFGGVNSYIKNESHDLLFLYNCQRYLTYYNVIMDPDYTHILEDTIYNEGISTIRGQIGTAENLLPDKIRNVSSAYRRWEDYITDPVRIQTNDADHEGMCLGEIHIYTDGRDMEYIPRD